MNFTFEHKAARITETKAKYSGASQQMKLAALEGLFKMALQFENQFNIGLLEWDKLVSLRMQINASITGIAELLFERDELDLLACQLWKTYHPGVWMFIDEPAFVTAAVHTHFVKIFGKIAGANPALQTLAVQLSQHDWGLAVEGNGAENASADTLCEIEELSQQLKANGCEKEVEVLWSYYAPVDPGRKQSFSWLLDHAEPERSGAFETERAGSEPHTFTSTGT